MHRKDTGLAGLLPQPRVQRLATVECAAEVEHRELLGPLLHPELDAADGRVGSAEHGADLQAKDANDRTPLDLAKGIGVPGIRQAAGDPHPETVTLIESLIAAKATR